MAYFDKNWKKGDLITASAMNNIEDGIRQVSELVDTLEEKIRQNSERYISSTNEENILLSEGEDLILNLDFNSPISGMGTLKVFVNDKEKISQRIEQGMTDIILKGSIFEEGSNTMLVYVLDNSNIKTNNLMFTVRYGGTKLVSTFDAYSAYEYGSVVRYYFTASALDTSLPLKFFMEIDGITQNKVNCESDIRNHFTFPSDLAVGNHYCRAWVTDGTTKSNVLTFNLIILDYKNQSITIKF